jgi:hypothetical protein
MNKTAKLIVLAVQVVERGHRIQKPQLVPSELSDDWWNGAEIGLKLVWDGRDTGNSWSRFKKEYPDFRRFLDRAYHFALDHSLQTGIQVRAELMRLYPQHYTPEELSTCPARTPSST